MPTVPTVHATPILKNPRVVIFLVVKFCNRCDSGVATLPTNYPFSSFILASMLLR